MEISVVFLFWIVLCILVGILAKKKKRSSFAYFLISMILSPVIGLIIVLIIGEKETPDKKQKRIIIEDKDEVDNTRRLVKTHDNDIYRFVVKNKKNNDFEEMKELILNQYKKNGYTNVSRNEDTYWKINSIYREDSYIQIKVSGHNIIMEAHHVVEEPAFNIEEVRKTEPSNKMDSSTKLVELSRLLEKGLLTEEEFMSEKEKILAD